MTHSGQAIAPAWGWPNGPLEGTLALGMSGMGDAPYLRDERVVATLPQRAPEYQMRAVLRREFHADSPSVRLLIEGPLGTAVEYWDATHVELVIQVLQRALPALRRAEEQLDGDWQAWLDATRAD